jgi:hypothetical protein
LNVLVSDELEERRYVFLPQRLETDLIVRELGVRRC